MPNLIESFDFRVHTDGGYSLINNEGAWAFVISEPSDGTIITSGSGVLKNQTNNIAELTAVLRAIEFLPEGSCTEVCTDSQYVIGVLSNPTWRPKKNIELIAQIKRIWREKSLGLFFRWVRGHSGDKLNELCDRMCDEAVGYDLNAEFEKYRKR